ncbi:MAG: Hcp family type VI secretion system effector [Pseudomonadota bacterium]
MAQPGYMTISAETQGDLHPGCMSADSVGTFAKASHEDEIQVLAIEFEIARPVDTQTGSLTGLPQHRGVTITKMIDKSSGQLMQAMTEGEKLQIAINWYRTKKAGSEEKYYTMKFTNATLVGRKIWIENTQDNNKNDLWQYENLTFTYAKVEETHEISGTSGSASAED